MIVIRLLLGKKLYYNKFLKFSFTEKVLCIACIIYLAVYVTSKFI